MHSNQPTFTPTPCGLAKNWRGGQIYRGTLKGGWFWVRGQCNLDKGGEREQDYLQWKTFSTKKKIEDEIIEISILKRVQKWLQPQILKKKNWVEKCLLFFWPKQIWEAFAKDCHPQSRSAPNGQRSPLPMPINARPQNPPLHAQKTLAFWWLYTFWMGPAPSCVSGLT